jgi:PAS domain S-box-containing protein
VVRTRNFIISFVIGAVVILAAAWVAIAANHRTALAEWRNRLSETAADRAALVGLWLGERRADARVTAFRPTVRTALQARGAAASLLAADFDSVAAGYGYDAVVLVRRDGAIIASSRGAGTLQPAHRAYLEQVIAGDTAAIALIGARIDSASLAVAAPVHDDRDRNVGAVLLLISPQRRLFPIALHGLAPTRSGEALLARVTGSDAYLIAARRGARSAAPAPHLSLDTAGSERERLLREGTGFARYADYGGVPVFGAAARVPGINWVVLLKVDASEALVTFNRTERLILIATALAVAALALALRVLARRTEAQQRANLAALEASERRFQEMMETVELLGVMMDRDGRITFCNDAFLTLLGWRRDEIAGRDSFSLFVPPELAELSRAAYHEAIRTGRVQAQTDHPVLTRRGARRMIHWNSTLLRDSAGGVVGLATIGEDVTAIREVEEALRHSEARYRELVEGARDLIFAIDPSGAVTWLNPAFETMTGWPRDEWLGRPFEEILVADDRAEARAVFERMMRNDPSRPTAQLRLRTRGGGERLGEFTGTPQVKDGVAVGILGVCRDVTERVTMEEQLRQSSRMEAVGQLAGGIAHDFNNLLTVIIGSTELLLSDMPEESAYRGDVQEIRNSAGRAATLTRQLLAFSRRQMLAPRDVDLNSLVTGAAGMLRRLIGEHIALVVKLAPEAGTVRADPGQLEQVIVNLAVNARDAMPRGGTLTITTTELRNRESVPIGKTQLPPGDWCVLAVRDTGVGMAPDVLAHVFEPFFTTKAVGKGTGLGLASAYGVIKQSQGFIAVDSAPGEGAAFRIYLPRHGAASAAAAPAGAPPSGAPHGTETVLLVEDETMVRAVARQALLRHGYRVLEATGGMEALSLTATGAAELDLLLTDVVMPGISGPELAERLRQRRPGLKVLFMSGYSDDAVENRRLLGNAPLLHKPFTPEQLARCVREVLDRTE